MPRPPPRRSETGAPGRSRPARSRGAMSCGSPSAGAELDVGVAGAERGDGQRHQRGARRGERRHAQPPAPQPQQRIEIGFGGVDLSQDRLGVLEQHRPGRRRTHAGAVADHQRRAGLGLEARDGLDRPRTGCSSVRRRQPRRNQRDTTSDRTLRRLGLSMKVPLIQTMRKFACADTQTARYSVRTLEIF